MTDPTLPFLSVKIYFKFLLVMVTKRAIINSFVTFSDTSRLIENPIKQGD